MVEHDKERKDAVTEVGAEELRRNLSEILGRSAFAKERFRIIRHGRTEGAIVSPEDLERLIALDAA